MTQCAMVWSERLRFLAIATIHLVGVRVVAQKSVDVGEQHHALYVHVAGVLDVHGPALTIRHREVGFCCSKWNPL